MGATKSKNKHKLTTFINQYWWLVFLLIIVLAIAVRLYGITKASIWHDEGFTAMLAARDWSAIWQGSARDVHPPLYYELLHGWTLLFGQSALALRSLSTLAGVVVVGLGMILTKKISNKNTALVAGLLLALNPFLIRYSQEARMYGVLGVFLLVAVLGVIYMLDKPRSWLGYVLYSLGIAAGLYTHYFTVLAVFAIWLYVIGLNRLNSKSRLIFDYRWWLANAIAVVLFMPWIPNMIAQLTRGQGLGWLPRASIQTFHDTIWQFFTFTDAHKLTAIIYWFIPLLVIVACIYVWLSDKTKYKYSRLIILFSFVPIFLAIIVSFFRPVFHERYFAFAVIGICIIIALAIMNIAKQRLWLASTITVLLLITQLIGVRNVNSQASHNMHSVMSELNNQFKSGDVIVAGELYVYFDGSFYNTTNQKILLFTGNGQPNGFGESGLIYDRDVYLNSLGDLKGEATGRVWIVGKTGDQAYYKQIPSNWQLLATYQAGYSEVRLYQIQ